MKKAFSILLQMDFTVVCEDNDFGLGFAELKINHIRCVSCFIQNSSETLHSSKEKKEAALTEGQPFEGRKLKHVSTEVVCKVIQNTQTVKLNTTCSGPRNYS